MRLSILLLAFVCLHSWPATAKSTDCPQISLEVIRIGEDAIYLQTKHSGNTCRWTGGDLDDLPADVGVNCFGQGVHHPVNTTEFCVEFPQPDGSIDCSATPSKACTTVYAYSQSPSSAPSPYPSEAPTESPAPSRSPSVFPSGQPTLSASPSVTPTFSPSNEPSSLPSISSAPTFAPVFTVARGIEIIFPDVKVWLNDQAKTDFENKTLEYLLDGSDSNPDQRLVQFESVRVTDQFIYDDTPGSNAFHVLLDVAGFVKRDEKIELDFNSYVSDFFSDQTVLDILYDDILQESYVTGSGQKTTNQQTGPKVRMIASFVSISILIGGLVSFYVRRKGVPLVTICRRNNFPKLRTGSFDIEDHISPKPTASNDSESIGCNSLDDSETPHLGGYPIVSTYRSKQKLHGISLPGRIRASRAEALREIEGSEAQRGLGTFQSSFLSADSNIEVPITPLTNYDMSHISPRGLESDADAESVPSPANSDGVILSRNPVTRSPEAIEVTQERNRAKGFFKRSNRQSQATKSDTSDAAVLLSSYGGASSSSSHNYP